MSEQRVVCAAILGKNGCLVCSPRHMDEIMREGMHNAYSSVFWAGAQQGFVDQYGKFLTREEALVIAKKNNQIIRRCGGDDKRLYSENLY